MFHPKDEHLLVIVDDHSRFPVVEVVSSTAFHVVGPAIESVLDIFGISITVLTDNGHRFKEKNSKVLQSDSVFIIGK